MENSTSSKNLFTYQSLLKKIIMKNLYRNFIVFFLFLISSTKAFSQTGPAINCDQCTSSYPYTLCPSGQIICTNNPWHTGQGMPSHEMHFPPCETENDNGVSNIYVYYEYWDGMEYIDDDKLIFNITGDPNCLSCQTFSDDMQSAWSQWSNICPDLNANPNAKCCVSVTLESNVTDMMQYNNPAVTIARPSGSKCEICNGLIKINVTDNYMYDNPEYPNQIPYTGGNLPYIYALDEEGNDISPEQNFWSIETTLLHEFAHYFGLPDDDGTGNFLDIGCYPKDDDGNAEEDILDIDLPQFGGPDEQNPFFGLSDFDKCWFELLYCCYNPPLSIEQNINKQSINNSFNLLNAPDPFSVATKINYSVKNNAHVLLRVYNSIGELITTLQDGNLEAGNYSAEFNGAGIARGVYYYVLTEGSSAAMRGMILVK